MSHDVPNKTRILLCWIIPRLAQCLLLGIYILLHDWLYVQPSSKLHCLVNFTIIGVILVLEPTIRNVVTHVTNDYSVPYYQFFCVYWWKLLTVRPTPLLVPCRLIVGAVCNFIIISHSRIIHNSWKCGMSNQTEQLIEEQSVTLLFPRGTLCPCLTPSNTILFCGGWVLPSLIEELPSSHQLFTSSTIFENRDRPTWRCICCLSLKLKNHPNLLLANHQRDWHLHQ